MRWTRHEALAALRRWIEENGRQPTSNEWLPTPEGCPSRPTINTLFGSWAHAMEEAGGVARTQGSQRSYAIEQWSADLNAVQKLAQAAGCVGADVMRLAFRRVLELSPEAVADAVAELPRDEHHGSGAGIYRAARRVLSEDKASRPALNGTARRSPLRRSEHHERNHT